MNSKENSRIHRSPFRLLVIIIASIILAEVFAMIVVYLLMPSPYPVTVLIDASIMTVLIFPVLYYLSFRPLIRQMERSWQAEEQLRAAHSELELRVQERTEELRIANAELEAEINVRKRTEEALRKSEFGLKRAQEIAHLGSWELDLSANRLTWSDEVYRIFGRQPGEFEPSYPEFLKIVHPDDRAPVDEAYSGSVRDGKDGYEIEHRIIRQPTGEIRILQEKADHFRDESGQIVRSVGMVHDITERKRAEEALRLSEEKFRSAFADAAIGFAMTMPDGHFVDANPAYCALTGYEIRELQAMEFSSLVHPADRDENMKRVGQMLAGQIPDFVLENRYLRRNGEDVWVRKSVSLVRNVENAPQWIIALVEDIAERKRAEDALRYAHDELERRVEERTIELAAANADLVRQIAERKEVERQLRLQTTAMESAANGIMITDHQGRIQWTNPALSHISGYQADDLIGQSTRIFRSGEHDAAYYRQLWGTILSGAVWRGEITNRRKDGEIYMEEQTITPVRDDQGKITQFIAVKQDITDRKQAELALRESEEKFRTLVEWTYDWEIWLDPGGKIIYTSPSCQRITGYRADEFATDPDLMAQIVHPDDRSRFQEHQRLFHDESAGAATIEYRIRDQAGSEHWIQHVCRPLFRTNQHYLGRRITNRDVTEQKYAEKDLEARNEKERILTQTIHTMQLDIARDLHDTLGQNISFLRMKLDYLSEKKLRKQTEVRAEIQSMARAAHESYDLMRGTLAVLQTPNSTDLFRLFTRYAEQIEERAAFEIKSSTRGEPRFMSARRMRQLFYIFREILNNVEKHAHASQVSIDMTWNQDRLQLVVSDNGTGFHLNAIQYGGHYGLRFMRERTELLNGTLNVQSVVGSGTTITLEVPYE